MLAKRFLAMSTTGAGLCGASTKCEFQCVRAHAVTEAATCRSSLEDCVPGGPVVQECEPPEIVC